jgi:uncharacterized protein involved in exopolysaccharide biosynthesis
MLTADQMRLRLAEARNPEHDVAEGLLDVVRLLEEVLPDLVALATQAQRTNSQLSDENDRLRRALHLSELSRGMPSETPCFTTSTRPLVAEGD